MNHPYETEINLELKRSEKALKAAELLFKDSFFEDALSRSYYAILHAAKAVLLFEKIHVESHEAVKRLFGLHLVKPGKIADMFSIILREEQDDRLLADYDAAFFPGEDQVEKRIADAKLFVSAMMEHLRKCGFR